MITSAVNSPTTTASIRSPPAGTVPATGTLSIAQRRRSHFLPQATLPKLVVPVVREGPTAADRTLSSHLDQPPPHRGLRQPTSPHRPSGTHPIAIPARRHEKSRPTTPLTAREEKGTTHFPWYDSTPQKPQISQSLRPSYRRPDHDKSPNFVVTSPPKQYLSKEKKLQVTTQGFSALSPTTAISMPSNHTYTPSSPLSPTVVPAGTVLPLGARARRGNDLHLPPMPLPRFHPANYQSPSSSTTITQPRNVIPSRTPRSPQLHQRQASDAQQKLKQYQRELVINATRTSALTPALGRGETPKAPHLIPRGSPGPATPLMLEEQGDYMIAGASGSLLGEGSPRDMVDQMIRDENARRDGIHSGQSSPAVSPAGGRG